MTCDRCDVPSSERSISLFFRILRTCFRGMKRITVLTSAHVTPLSFRSFRGRKPSGNVNCRKDRHIRLDTHVTGEYMYRIFIPFLIHLPVYFLGLINMQIKRFTFFNSLFFTFPCLNKIRAVTLWCGRGEHRRFATKYIPPPPFRREKKLYH